MFKKIYGSGLKISVFPFEKELVRNNKTARYLCLAWLSSKIVF